VVELGQRLGLRLEALDEAVVLEELGRQRLERDLTGVVDRLGGRSSSTTA